MNMDTPSSRLAFEQWAQKQGWAGLSWSPYIHRYINIEVDIAWRAWQAALAQPNSMPHDHYQPSSR